MSDSSLSAGQCPSPLLLAPAVLDRLGTALPPDTPHHSPGSCCSLAAGCGWVSSMRSCSGWSGSSYIRYLLNSWHFMARLAWNDHAPCWRGSRNSRI
ncbi:MAG: hypothetical protein HPM95_06510 [Alphaproteobacteria bacterium]|nr:hypothetical protein [Alphaproteobacteria bacterium]